MDALFRCQTFRRGHIANQKSVDCDGKQLTFYEHAYDVDISTQPFWGGNHATASWLSKETIEKLFSHFGFSLTIHSDVLEWGIGHNITALPHGVLSFAEMRERLSGGDGQDLWALRGDDSRPQPARSDRYVPTGRALSRLFHFPLE
jgi:hypothetical protein